MKLSEIEKFAQWARDKYLDNGVIELSEQTLKLCQLVRMINVETLKTTGYKVTAGHGIEIDEAPKVLSKEEADREFERSREIE